MTPSPEKPDPVEARGRLAKLLTIRLLTEAEKTDLTLLLADHAKLREGLERISALAESYYPILDHLCPAGTLPTPWQEQAAQILAQPFAVARTALGDQPK